MKYDCKICESERIIENLNINIFLKNCLELLYLYSS